MSDHLSIRTGGEGGTTARTSSSAILIIAMLVGAAATAAVVWLMLTRHPFGWGGLPPELRALPAHPTPGEYQRALEAVRHRELRNDVIFAVAELLLAFVIHKARPVKVAGGAALGFTALGGLLTYFTGSLVPLGVGALAGICVLLSIKVANQWEKCVVLRFGRYHALRGPGMFRIVPIIDRVAAVVDGRVRTTAVHAEAALTRDTVPVHVDAVIFWVVWDVGKAVLEVQDFDAAVGLMAQTALLESIGRHDLGEMITERSALGRDLQSILEQKATPWGITLQSVEIRDLRLPRALQDALSRQAQAERERQARVIFGDAEVQLAHKFAEASVPYRNDPTALHLRAMNMLYDVIKEKGTMVVVPASALGRKSGRTRRSVAYGR
jgi:regulator of protease activity HflC (stomatin/prohibitin superfamily)